MARKYTPYSNKRQNRGKIARARAKTTKGGKGPIAKRAGYKKTMKQGIKNRRKPTRAHNARSLAKTTKGGKGLIKKRSGYKKHVGK